MSAGSPAVQAAALIRADIRAAVQNGTLGVLPPGISFSVSACNLATMPGVTVTVYGAGVYGAGGQAVNEAGAALRRKLLEIAGRHWQPAVSGGFTDVKFIGLEPPDEEAVRVTGPPTARGSIPGHPKRKD